jgi:hypothetical protein
MISLPKVWSINKSGFWEWLMSFDFLTFISKNHCMRLRLLFLNFYRHTFKGGGAMCIFLDIVLERDVQSRNSSNFWDKNWRNSVFRHLKGIMHVLWLFINQRIGVSGSNNAFAEEDYRKPKDKLWLDGEEMDFGLPKV